MSIQASEIADKIVRSINVDFSSGRPQTGSAFFITPNLLVTCAHVVLNEDGNLGVRVSIKDRENNRIQGKIIKIERNHDLALIEAEKENSSLPIIEINSDMPLIGQNVIFAGQPQGIKRPGMFPGMISDIGYTLIPTPKCDIIQIAGMINSGNSGGPLLDSESGSIIGVITAKHVPLLKGINELASALKKIPQFPSDVAIGKIDFSKFVNLVIQSMWQLSAVL